MKSEVQTTRVNPVTPKTDVVDGAVGVEKRYWFVAIVNNHSERKTAERLQDKRMEGAYECYIPIQRDERIWKNGRKNVIDKILLPAMVFIRCTKGKQKEAKQNNYVFSFLKDPAIKDKGCKGYLDAAIIPDDQFERFREMLEKSDKPVSVENAHFKLGDKVKVCAGSLIGLEGNIIKEPNATYLVIRIEALGYAKVQIDLNEVEPIGEQ